MRRPSSPSWSHWRPLHSRAWYRWLLSLARTALSSLLVLWSLMWHALFYYKVFWALVFQVMREISAALGSRLENCSEACEGDGTRTPIPELEEPGAGRRGLQEKLQGLQDASSAFQERLVGLEAEVKHVSTELRAEKLLWSSRYLELLREQQDLRERLQERGWSPWREDKDPLGMQQNAEAPSVDGTDGWCMGDNGHGRQTPSGGRTCPAQPDSRLGCTLQGCPASSGSDQAAASLALAGSSPRPSSAATDMGSIQLRWTQQHPGAWVSVPRSPRDLRLGHRVKVLLQSGGIGVGTIRYLGVFPDQVDFSVGVELEALSHGAHDRFLVGHYCFPCKPGHGVFVPFSKVLLVWEQTRTLGMVGQPHWRAVSAGSEGTGCAQGWDHRCQRSQEEEPSMTEKW